MGMWIAHSNLGQFLTNRSDFSSLKARLPLEVPESSWHKLIHAHPTSSRKLRQHHSNTVSPFTLHPYLPPEIRKITPRHKTQYPTSNFSGAAATRSRLTLEFFPTTNHMQYDNCICFHLHKSPANSPRHHPIPTSFPVDTPQPIRFPALSLATTYTIIRLPAHSAKSLREISPIRSSDWEPPHKNV